MFTWREMAKPIHPWSMATLFLSLTIQVHLVLVFRITSIAALANARAMSESAYSFLASLDRNL
jgi:hypothetical protein